jgi:hypothetical protein
VVSRIWVGSIVIASHADATDVEAIILLNAQFFRNARCESILRIGQPIVKIGGEIRDDAIENAPEVPQNALRRPKKSVQ